VSQLYIGALLRALRLWFTLRAALLS